MSINKELEDYTKPALVPPVLVLIGGILAVSSAFLFIRYAQKEAPSLVIAAYRLGLATLILTPYILSKRQKELCSLSINQKVGLFLSGTFLAFHFAAWITSLELTSIASSVVFVSTSPLWVALATPLVLKDKLPRIVWIGILVALAGSMVVGLGQACQLVYGRIICPPLGAFIQGKSFLGNLLALVGALSATGYLLIGRKLRRSISLTTYIYFVYGSAAVVLLFMVLITGKRLIGYSLPTNLCFLALAVIPQLFGHSSFNWALKYLTAAYISVSLLGEPIFSTILAYLVLHEKPSPIELLGGAFILLGIFVVSRSESR